MRGGTERGVPGVNRPDAVPKQPTPGARPTEQKPAAAGTHQSPPRIAEYADTVGRQMPGANLPVPVDQPRSRAEIVAHVIPGEVVTPYEGSGTLYSRKGDEPMDAVLVQEYIGERVAALAVPDALHGKPVTVIDLDGNGADQTIEEVDSLGIPIAVVEVSAVKGGIFDFLSPKVHGRAAAAYGEYENPSDEKYAGDKAANIAEKIAEVRAQIEDRDPATVRISTKDIHDGFKVVRGTAGGLSGVKLDWREVQALQESDIIAQPDKTARAGAIEALDRAFSKLITASNSGQEVPSQSDEDVRAYVFTAGSPTGDLDDTDDGFRRVLAKAAPELARVQRDAHVIVTDAQLLGNRFGDMFPRGTADLIFDPADTRFAEVVDMIGKRGAFYVGTINDEPTAEKLAVQFGTKEVVEAISVGITGTLSAGDHDENNRTKTSGGGGSKANGGGMGSNTSGNFSAAVTTGRVKIPVIRGQDIRGLEPWAGFLRRGNTVYIVTVFDGQSIIRPQRPSLITPQVKRILQNAQEIAQRAAGVVPLDSKQRAALLKSSVDAPSSIDDDIQVQGVHKHLTFRAHQAGYSSLTEYLTEDPEGKVYMQGKLGHMWRTKTREGKRWVKRQQRAAAKEARMRRVESFVDKVTQTPEKTGLDTIKSGLMRAGEWLGTREETGSTPEEQPARTEGISGGRTSISLEQALRLPADAQDKMLHDIRRALTTGSVTDPVKIATLRRFDAELSKVRNSARTPDQDSAARRQTIYQQMEQLRSKGLGNLSDEEVALYRRLEDAMQWERQRDHYRPS